MLLASQNMLNYDLMLPKDIVFRINLAWCNTLEQLQAILSKNKESEFFLDLPVGRIKPPNNKYSLEDIISVIKENPSIIYFAVSNVENKNNLQPFTKHGYLVVAPHVSISVGGKEVSGTSMRELLGSPKYSDEERRKLFKDAFGYFDEGVYLMMHNKFKKLFNEGSDDVMIFKPTKIRKINYKKVNIDNTYPEYLLKNVNLYANWIA